MLGFIRLVIALLAVLFAFGMRRAGFTYLMPLGLALALGWPLSRLATVPRRYYVFALAVLTVHTLWILCSVSLGDDTFDTPVVGSLFLWFAGGGEMLEIGYLGAWYLDLPWIPHLLGCLIGIASLIALGFLLLGTDSPWSRYLACAVVALLALQVARIIQHDGLRNTPPSVFAHLLLRLTALGLLVIGMLTESTDRLLRGSLASPVDPNAPS